MAAWQRLILVVLCLVPGAVCQSDLQTATENPAAAFLSPSKYTNAFFGFSLPLPNEPALQLLTLKPSPGSNYFLFGLKSVTTSHKKPQMTAFTVFADKSNATPEGAHDAAARNPTHDAKRVDIGGKAFWRAEWEQGSPAGKMNNVRWVTALNGYTVTFYVVSFDNKLSKRLVDCIASIMFFDPSKSREMAGPDSRPYVPN